MYIIGYFCNHGTNIYLQSLSHLILLHANFFKLLHDFRNFMLIVVLITCWIFHKNFTINMSKSVLSFSVQHRSLLLLFPTSIQFTSLVILLPKYFLHINYFSFQQYHWVRLFEAHQTNRLVLATTSRWLVVGLYSQLSYGCTSSLSEMKI